MAHKSLKQFIENNFTIGILALIFTSFAAGWGAYDYYLGISDRYLKLDYVNEHYINKKECLKKTTTVYINGNDTIDIFSIKEKKELINKLDEIDSALTPDFEIDKLNKDDKLTIYYSELDRIVGQFEFMNKVLNGESLKSLNDSLNRKFMENTYLINEIK